MISSHSARTAILALLSLPLLLSSIADADALPATRSDKPIPWVIVDEKQQVPVHSVAWSPLGTYIATGHEHGQVFLWNTRTGKVECVTLSVPTGGVGEPKGAVQIIRFSPDEKTLFFACGKEAGLVTIGGGEVWPDHIRASGELEGATFSPDGKQLVLIELRNPVRVISAETGKTVWTADRGAAASYSPDGKELALIDYNGTVSVRLTRDWSEVRNFTSNFRWPDVKWPIKTHPSISFSPDGKRLLVSYGAGVKGGGTGIFDTLTGERLQTYMPGGQCATFSPDGTRVLLGTFNKQTKWMDLALYDAATAEKLMGFNPGDAPKQPAAFSPDGRWIVADAGNEIAYTVNAWLVSTPIGVEAPNPPRLAELLTNDGTWNLTAARDGSWAVWNFFARDPRIDFLQNTPDTETFKISGAHGDALPEGQTTAQMLAPRHVPGLLNELITAPGAKAR